MTTISNFKFQISNFKNQKLFYKLIALVSLWLSYLFLVMPTEVYSQYGFNHPELKWRTFETAHFKVHYHEGAEWTARESANIAEAIYKPITSFYDFEPDEKTHLVIKDTDDYSNGAAYYYDNKIVIWATPLDFPLRGNHNWLRDVITHEFTHIVSLQKAMKFTRLVPAAYFQLISYEDEKREDVIYGYPRVIASYPFPGVVIPMWLAEGLAQYMFPEATNDFWDSHRDMILRDRVIHDNLLSFSKMNSFGKRGIGNESVYNQGYAFVKYLSERFGPEFSPKLMDIISSPLSFSINPALKKITGIPGKQIYQEWKIYLEDYYTGLLREITENIAEGKILVEEAANQTYPQWAGDTLIYYLSNKEKDYFSQTSLYVYDIKKEKSQLVKSNVRSRISISPDSRYVYYSRKSKPNKHGSIYYDIYKFDLKKKKEDQITKWRRAYNPSLSPDGSKLVFVTGKDGTSDLILLNLSNKEEKVITQFDAGVEVFSADWSPDGKQVAFDYMTDHGRDISVYDFEGKNLLHVQTERCDTRNPVFSPDGKWIYFASDRTGIFNIYRKSLITNDVEQITNVRGGAFSPSVNDKDQITFVLFDDSAFKISMLNRPAMINSQSVKYSNYADNIPAMIQIHSSEDTKAVSYQDQFSKIFLLPRLMIDYGTVKPGLYFFSNEIIDRFNIIGGAGFNKIKDRDLFVILEYHQWKPTLHIEIYNISRSIFNVETEINSRPASLDYAFYLTEFVFGMSRPLDTVNKLRLDVVYSKYRTSTDTEIPVEGIYEKGFSYDYYKGTNFKLNWRFRKVLPTVNINTNPDNGIELNTNISRNYDKFIRGFNVNNAYSTLEVDFRNNYYWRIEHEGIWHHRYPVVSNLVGNFNWRLGWISKPDIDSFFNFFAGGMPGLQGYPFYSIEGRNLLSFHYTYRIPLFLEKDIQVASFNLENAFFATYFEAGNAWSRIEDYPAMKWETFKSDPTGIAKKVISDFKRDIGFQLRFSGFSFYSYPTAISLDFVYGLDKFTTVDRQENEPEYGKEWRTYLTILFGL